MLVRDKLGESDKKAIAQEGAKCNKLGVVERNVITSVAEAKPPFTPAVEIKEIGPQK